MTAPMKRVLHQCLLQCLRIRDSRICPELQLQTPSLARTGWTWPVTTRPSDIEVWTSIDGLHAFWNQAFCQEAHEQRKRHVVIVLVLVLVLVLVVVVVVVAAVVVSSTVQVCPTVDLLVVLWREVDLTMLSRLHHVAGLSCISQVYASKGRKL